MYVSIQVQVYQQYDMVRLHVRMKLYNVLQIAKLHQSYAVGALVVGAQEVCSSRLAADVRRRVRRGRQSRPKLVALTAMMSRSSPPSRRRVQPVAHGSCVVKSPL